MDVPYPVRSVTICRQCIRYADLLGRNLAEFSLFDPGTFDAVLEEITRTSGEEDRCACEVLRMWGIWGQKPTSPLSRDPVWLSEMPPRNVKVRLNGKDGDLGEKMLRSVRPDSLTLGAWRNQCRCSGGEVCTVCRRLHNEEDDLNAGFAIEW